MYCDDSIHIYRTCVQSTNEQIYAGLQAEFCTIFLFSLNICFFSRARKAGDVSNTETSNPGGIQQIDPTLKILKSFFK